MRMIRAGLGYFFSGPDRFGPAFSGLRHVRAADLCLFMANFFHFLTDFSAQRQFLRFGLDRATQNPARVGPLKTQGPIFKCLNQKGSFQILHNILMLFCLYGIFRGYYQINSQISRFAQDLNKTI